MLDEQLLHPLPSHVPVPVDVSRWNIYGDDQTQQTEKTVFDGSDLTIDSQPSTFPTTCKAVRLSR